MKLKQWWYRLTGKPTFDKIFYVPFWDCPYMCDFCCVDSLPGKPPAFPDEGEDMLFELIDKLYHFQQQPIELHVYGGEPMMRKKYMEHLAEKVKANSKVKQFILYTTLRSNSPKGLYSILGKERLQMVINPSTINAKVEKRLEEFKEVCVIYHNEVFFPTGRGAVGLEGNQSNFWQRVLPIGFPGRGCFAASSGMLVNGQQNSVHLCCLPQSPILGTLEDDASTIFQKYKGAVQSIPAKINKEARQKKCVHPCQVCNDRTGYVSTAGGGCNSFTMEAFKALERSLKD